MANKYLDLLGTTLSSFGIGPKATRATLDTSAITAPRTHTLPDASGTVALLSQCATAAQGTKADSAVQPNTPITPTSVTASDRVISNYTADYRGLTASLSATSTHIGGNTATGCWATNTYFDGAAWVVVNGTKDAFAFFEHMSNRRFEWRYTPAGGSQINLMYLNANGTISLKNADTTTMTQQPRIFVQSADPGAAAADGDLWFW